MKQFKHFVLKMISIIQLCIALFLGVYSLGIGMAQTRTEDNFARYKKELKEASDQAKTLEAQLALSPANFADDGYNNAVSAENFSTVVLIVSIVLFSFGVVQLVSIQKIERQLIVSS